MPRRSRSSSTTSSRRRGRARYRQTPANSQQQRSVSRGRTHQRQIQTRRSSTRRRTWGEFGRQVTAGLAAGTLATMSGPTTAPVTNFMTGARFGFRIAAPNLNFTKKENYFMPGYRGKTAKLSKNLSYADRIILPYLRQGSLINSEFYGTNNDPDCMYIGHTTFSPDLVALITAQAVIRKLLKKVGFNVSTVEEEVPIFDPSNSAATLGGAISFYIAWETKAAGNASVKNYYNIPNDATLLSLATNTIAPGLFGNLTRENEGWIERIGIYEGSWGFAAGLPSVYSSLRCQLDMKREIIHIYCKSVLTVQNRTSNDSGTTSTETVNVQPLIGLQYRFSGGVPQHKYFPNVALSSFHSYGVLLKRAQDCTPQNSFKEPPHPKQFNNITKSGKVRMESGDIKKTTISDHWTGYFNNILGSKLKTQTNNSQQVYAPGHCEIIALAEVMNSGSANNITLTYECKKTCGAFLVTTPDPVIVPQYAATPFNG
jgi:hypothetical protein